MPTIQSDSPFEHVCSFCGTKPTHIRKRVRTDKQTGERNWAGEYWSCDCYSLTAGYNPKSGKITLNQTETCTNPDKLAA